MGFFLSKIQNHYDNLKVQRTAPIEVIKAAYRGLSQKYHPDRNPNSPEAARIMSIINEAYEVLSDPVKREKHDRWIDQEEQQQKQSTINQENDTSQRTTNANQKQNNAPKKTEKQSKENFLLFVIPFLFLAALVIFLLYNISSKNTPYSPPDEIDNSLASEIDDYLASEVVVASEAVIPAIQTSFDCSKAKSISENLICNNPSLAEADLQLAQVLAQAKIHANDKKALTNRVRKQWNYREKNCTDEACLFDWYAYQKSILQQVISTGDAKAGITNRELKKYPLPQTGYSSNSHIEEGLSPLKIATPYGADHYFVKIEDAYTKKPIANYFIRAGDTLEVNLPLGTYNIKYASGKNWYGDEYLFGQSTAYAKANQTFNFSFDGYQYNGYTIELIQQVNGNLKTDPINKNQF